VHRSVYEWVASQVAVHDLRSRPVLEVGSLNVNGSVRGLFSGPYTGTDMRAGPGVDRVVNAHELASYALSEAPGVVLCLEMLEHDDQPWVSVGQMHDVAGVDGWLLASARGYDTRGCFPVHDFPQDYWRFSVPGMRSLLEWAGWRDVQVSSDPDPLSPGVFAVARA
jgi:hypothetical protein